jgi:O-antigen/teichoic acid export membrane protein
MAGAAINLLICSAAAPRWGMVSVACATPASYAAMAALGAWQSNRVFPVPYEWRRLLHLGIQVTLLFGVDRWLATRGIAPLSATGVLSKAALLAALPIMLLATGFFRHGEMRALRSLATTRRSS